MKNCDLIIKAGYLLPMDDSFSVIHSGAVAVAGGKIAAVGPEDQVCREYSSDKVIGGPMTVALPGFVNAHTHSPMVYFRGLEDDLPLKEWLEDHIWPAENRWLSHEFVKDAVELACLEMLKAGITAFSDMYFYGDAIAESAKKAGLRAIIGAGILDFPSATAQSVDEYLANAGSFIDRWLSDDLIVPGVAPHAPYTCSPETLLRAKELAVKHAVPLHLHLAETQWEVQEIISRYGMRPIELLQHHGLLDKKVIAAHCVWPSDEEISMLSASGAGVVHCIESNLKLASGIAPVVKMLKQGCRVCLGTDGAASNNDLDIMSEMATAAKVHKAVSSDPTVLSAPQALRMATRSGAEVLGLGEITGSLEPGKSADMIVASLNKPHLMPLYDIYSHIVYSMKSSDITDVIVQGRVLLEAGQAQSLNEEAIAGKARGWSRKIRP